MSSRHSSSSHRRRSPSPHERRRHSPSRRDSGRDSGRDRERRERTPTPPPRDPGSLPSSFSREPREDRRDDQRNVLERMDKACDSGPMKVLLRCVTNKEKLKVWTRNYREVRGICSGFVTFFDKHWNLVMKDVEEIYLRPKKGKTPYLEELGPGDAEKIPEAKPKVPKEKKAPGEVAKPKPVEEPAKPAEVGAGDAGTEPMAVEGGAKGEGTAKKKKKKKKKRKKTKMEKRTVSHLFLRGDNIVMIAVCQAEDEEEEEEDDDEVEEVAVEVEGAKEVIPDDDDDIIEINQEEN